MKHRYHSPISPPQPSVWRVWEATGLHVYVQAETDAQAAEKVRPYFPEFAVLHVEICHPTVAKAMLDSEEVIR